MEELKELCNNLMNEITELKRNNKSTGEPKYLYVYIAAGGDSDGNQPIGMQKLSQLDLEFNVARHLVYYNRNKNNNIETYNWYIKHFLELESLKDSELLGMGKLIIKL